MIRILFVNRRFEHGGVERQLIELVKGMDKSRFSVTVATFYDGGALHEEIEHIRDVQIILLHKKSRWDLLPFLWRLWQVLRMVKPQIIHGYMGIANQLCVLMGKLSGAKIVWGVRASNMDLARGDWLTRVCFQTECFLARFADLIIVNSTAGREYHLSHGFPEEKIVLIPNGVDTARFSPDPKERQETRTEWCMTQNERVIGLVGRLDPVKDHPTFLKAAALLAQERGDVRYVCVGGGPLDYRKELQALGRQLGLEQCLIWAGPRENMPAVYNALDIATLSSYSEGFPNAIAEALACGVPCVVTDVGDAARIVGETGVVVPPQNAEALADGWRVMLSRLAEDRLSLAEKARARVVLEFGRDRLVQKTSDALMGLL